MNQKTGLLVLFAALILLPLAGFAQEAVHWEVTLDSALRVAGRTDRLVLIHFWAPWCTYCKRLEAEVLTTPDVMAELNANYVPIKINADHFPATAKQYGVTALPTTVIVSPQGQVIDSMRGWVSPSDYVARLHSVALRAKPSGAAVYAQIPAGSAPAAANHAVPPQTLYEGSPATPGQIAAGQPAVTANAAAGIASQPSNVPPQPAYGAQSPPGLVPPGYVPQPAAGTGTASPAPPPPSNPVPYQAPAASGGYGPSVAGGPPTGTGQWPNSNSPAAVPPYAQQPPPYAQQPTPYAQQPTAYAQQPPPYAQQPTPYAQQPPAVQPTSPPPPSAAVAIPAGNPSLAMDGYCPVSLAEKYRWVPGDRRWGAIHRGHTYLFAGPEEQRRFFADPDRYAPLFSGNDIVLATDLGQIVPGSRQHGVFLGGRVFLFSSEESLAKFVKEPSRYGNQAMAALRAGTNPGPTLR